MLNVGRDPAVWQVAAAPSGYSCADLFLNYGVVLFEQGDAGLWPPRFRDADPDSRFVRRLETEVQKGDILLLRTGLSTVCAIGLVSSEYQHMPQFDDVNGRDMRHGRRVRWSPYFKPFDFDDSVFGANPPRISRVQEANARDLAIRFLHSPPVDWQESTLPELPAVEEMLEIPPPELVELVAQVQNLAGHYGDPKAFGDRPMEDELVAHNIVPFLRALGWPAEKIAVK